VLALIQRLPDDSLTAALAAGGRHLFGWGPDRHMQANIFDAINVNTKATGNWRKGKAPDFPLAQRPNSADTAAKPKSRVTVADLYKRFSGRT
jgi:hypothetical protein